MLAFFQWALAGGFWRFAGVVVLIFVVADAIRHAFGWLLAFRGQP